MSDSKIDVFMRIKNHFKSLIEKGAFLEGESLPSVRQTAMDLGVNPNTALADDQMIEIIPKKGAYVKAYEISDNHLVVALKHLLDELMQKRSSQEIIQIIKTYLGGNNHD
jgi:DNA-binding transcriptional regulator YhcF (GntR family)